jgi:glyoxalase family protein
MKLEGVHHVTAITADAQLNLDFYVGVMGLRLVKKTVNQDNPGVYHLFYADDDASAGSDITFFEYPGLPEGRAGAGMVHTVVWRVGSEESLSFWEQRLGDLGHAVERTDQGLAFRDPEGLRHLLTVSSVSDAPLSASNPDIPAEHALQGFEGVRAYSAAPDASAALLSDGLGFERTEEGWEARGSERGGTYVYDTPPAEPGLQGAGTVHHVAWASKPDELDAWRTRVMEVGASPTPQIDRFYFKAVYFPEPSGVLFELSSLGPGFTVDEPIETLGEKLSLPPDYEHLRDQVEPNLRPLVSPVAGRNQ